MFLGVFSLEGGTISIILEALSTASPAVYNGGGNGVASVPSSPYTFTMCREGILAAILFDFLLEIEIILHGEVIHLKEAMSNVG